MASIIKNKIFKLLSKFTKGLSTDKINVSAFKGEGELSNLELDERILTDLLELPSWLRLTHAVCTRVAFRVSWTKLKSIPIRLNIDDIIIDVETCEELRKTGCDEGKSSYAEADKYSLIHEVIDGVKVMVNKVKITFTSVAFTSIVEFSKIVVESKSPDWENCDLSFTRLKDNLRGQILIFKEIEWQHSRIEATSTADKKLPPLKLLTTKARCRIILKKRLSDCSVLGCRLAIILEDLLWVLTDLQLRAALHFAESLEGLIQKATEETRKKKAARKLETLPEYQAQQSQSVKCTSESKIFAKYDVIETSYHFLAKLIDIHITDDSSACSSCHPELARGGTIQVLLNLFRIDHYPYHLATSDRNHWATYKNIPSCMNEWRREAQLNFNKAFTDLSDIIDVRLYNAGRSSAGSCRNQLKKLMTSCTILRILDFNISQVSTLSMDVPRFSKDFIAGLRKQRRSSQAQGDKERFSVHEHEPVLHIEFTYSYFPGDYQFPLPAPQLYIHLNPIEIHFDILTILWLRAFSLSLEHSLFASSPQMAKSSELMYIDVNIEAIQTRVIFESAIDHPGQKDRPKSLHIQVSRATISNVRSAGKSSRANLEKCIDTFMMCSLFFNKDFPSISSDFSVFNQKFRDHSKGVDNLHSPSTILMKNERFVYKPDLLWAEARDVWLIHLEPIYGDFYGTRAVGKDHPVPFLDAFPLTLWVYFKNPTPENADANVKEDKTADIQVLASVTTLLSIQLNHYQYLFLLRLSEDIKELSTYLGIDLKNLIEDASEGTIAVGAVLPQVEITLVMPSQSPGKESSGGDMESVYPESSSLQDDVTIHGNWHSSNSFASQQQQPGNIATEKKLPSSETSLEMKHNKVQRNSISGNLSTSAATLKAIQSGPKIFTAVKPANDTISFKSQQSVPFSIFSNSIKKKIDKVMSSLDLGTKNSPEDISDTMSIRSDISSGSDNIDIISGDYNENLVEGFILNGMESLFNVGPPNLNQVTEVGWEVNEDTFNSSNSERDSFGSSWKRRDLVSLSTFKFGKVEVFKQAEGLNGALKIQISSIVLEECPSIPWDEFQNKFSSRTRDWVEVPLDAGVRPKIKVRMDQYLKPKYQDFKSLSSSDWKTVLNWFEDVADIRLESICLNMNASTVSGLNDLVEDEIFPPAAAPLPVTILLQDVKLHILEDRPPNNITSPGGTQMDFVITQLIVHRDESGVIEIRSPKSVDSDKSRISEVEHPLSSTTQNLLSENEELRRRLSALQGLSEEFYRLKNEKQNSENNLRLKLEAAQNLIEDLLENKKELLDKISTLGGQIQSARNSKR